MTYYRYRSHLTICNIRVIWFYISSLTSHERPIIKYIMPRPGPGVNIMEPGRDVGLWGLLIHLDPGPLCVTCLHVTQSVNCYAFQRYPMLKKITNDGSFKSVSVF